MEIARDGVRRIWRRSASIRYRTYMLGKNMSKSRAIGVQRSNTRPLCIEISFNLIL